MDVWPPPPRQVPPDKLPSSIKAIPSNSLRYSLTGATLFVALTGTSYGVLKSGMTFNPPEWLAVIVQNLLIIAFIVCPLTLATGLILGVYERGRTPHRSADLSIVIAIVALLLFALGVVYPVFFMRVPERA